MSFRQITSVINIRDLEFANQNNIILLLKMKAAALLVLATVSALISAHIHLPADLGQGHLGNDTERVSPGLSMSLDLKLIEQFKDTHMSSLIKELNGQVIENINIGKDGYLRSNRAFVKLRTNKVNLEVNETSNAYKMQISDLYLFIRSQEFKYNLWFVPIKATLDVEVGDVDLYFEIDLLNKTINYTDPRTQKWEMRAIPQIQIQKADLKIDPKKMKFNIGGSIVAQVVDIILPMFSRLITTIMNTQVNDVVSKKVPSMFNDDAIKQQGFFVFGDLMPRKEWYNTTMDYQLEHMKLSKDRTLNLAFNGTFFNNFTTGYRHVPGVPKPHSMPFYDPKINSTWQLFISTFLLEHAARTTLDEGPYEHLLVWNFLGMPEFALTTDACEAFFPYATQKFGNNVPVDLNVKIANVWDWTSNYTNQSLSFKINLKADAYLHLPNGGRHLIGTIEFFDGQLILELNVKNMTVWGEILSVDFQTAYSSTTYGISRYETTPYLINIIKFGALHVLNGKFLSNGFPIPSQFSLLSIKDVYLGFQDDYIALGLTPHFKKIPKNNTNGTDSKNKTQGGNTTFTFMDRFMTNLYKITEEVTQPFRSKPTLQESLFGNEHHERDDDSIFFEKFDKKRQQSCSPGRCGYISQVIDDLEKDLQV